MNEPRSSHRILGVTDPELYALRPLLPSRDLAEPPTAPPWPSGSSAEIPSSSFIRRALPQSPTLSSPLSRIPPRTHSQLGAQSVRVHPYRTSPRPHEPISAIPRRLISNDIYQSHSHYPASALVPAPQSLGPWRAPSAATANRDFVLAPYAVAGLHRIKTANTGREWPETGARDSERHGPPESVREVKSPSPSSPASSTRSLNASGTALTSPSPNGVDSDGVAEALGPPNLDGGLLGAMEVIERLEDVFILYLKYLCSNETAQTATGDAIHQPLMASKTQRLDNACEFRPFRFRIQAFTTGFAEWIQEDAKRRRSQLPITPRQIREFLWDHPLISRFNYDGKKSKSKGNHVGPAGTTTPNLTLTTSNAQVWTVDSRRSPDGERHFRTFERQVVGTLIDSARLFDRRGHVGFPLTWTPQLWDPRRSLHFANITYGSPPGSLPHWLRWENGVLSGTPTHVTRPESPIIVHTIARLVEEGRESVYENRFELQVTEYCPSRWEEDRAADTGRWHRADEDEE